MVTKADLQSAFEKKKDSYNAWFAKFQTYSKDKGIVTNETLLAELDTLWQEFNKSSNEYIQLRNEWITEHSENVLNETIESEDYIIDNSSLKSYQPRVYAKDPLIDDVEFIPDSCKSIDDILEDKDIDWERLTGDINTKNDVKSLSDKLGINKNGETSLTKEQFQTLCDVSGLTDKLGLSIDDIEKIQKGIDIEIDITSKQLSKENIEKQYKKVSEAMGDFKLELPKAPQLPVLAGPSAIVTVITMALKKAEIELKKSLAEKAKKMAMDTINKNIPKNTKDVTKKAEAFKSDISGKKTGFEKVKEKMIKNANANDPTKLKTILEEELKEKQGEIGKNNKEDIKRIKNELKEVNDKINEAKELNEALKKIEQEKLNDALEDTGHNKAKEYEEYVKAKNEYEASIDFLVDRNAHKEWENGLKN